MSTKLSRTLALLLSVAAQAAWAGTPIHELTCADYLGIETEPTAPSQAGNAEAKRSAAYQAGLKLGISMRQANMANWIHGYLTGYQSTDGKRQGDIVDIDGLRSRLRMHCGTHTDQTMQQVAEAFKPR